MGWVYYKLGDYKRAVTELEKANQLTPDDSTISEHLADSYVKLSRVEKAIEFYEKALKLDPKSDQKERLQKKIQELKENVSNSISCNPARFQSPNFKIQISKECQIENQKYLVFELWISFVI